MRIILSLLSVLILSSCYQPERDCKHFKNGTFEFEALVGTEVLKTTFTRSDSIEIDYFKGKSDTSSIRWINDCEYIVKKLHPRNKAEKKSVHMKILTTTDNSYTFEYNIVGDNNKSKGIAIKTN